MKSDSRYIKPSVEMDRLVKRIISDAIKYQKLTGKKLGVTGEVGELLAARRLKLQLCSSSIEAGFDAKDKSGKKVQIKSRRSEQGEVPSPKGRTGTFSKHKFDYALLVLLSDKYKILEIWRAGYASVSVLVKKHKRRNPTIQEFEDIANKRVYPK
jgi:hypothetical protein